MKQTITLARYFELGGKLENLTGAINSYKNETGLISFSHTNSPSFGNPNGVKMYKIGDSLVAEEWVKVEVLVVLDSQYLK